MLALPLLEGIGILKGLPACDPRAVRVAAGHLLPTPLGSRGAILEWPGSPFACNLLLPSSPPWRCRIAAPPQVFRELPLYTALCSIAATSTIAALTKFGLMAPLLPGSLYPPSFAMITILGHQRRETLDASGGDLPVGTKRPGQD